MGEKTKSLVDRCRVDKALLLEALPTHCNVATPCFQQMHGRVCRPDEVEVMLTDTWVTAAPILCPVLCACVPVFVRCPCRPAAWLMSVPLIALSLQGFQLRLGPWPRADQVQLICHQAGQGSLYKLHRPGRACTLRRQSLSCLDLPSISLAALIFPLLLPPRPHHHHLHFLCVSASRKLIHYEFTLSTQVTCCDLHICFTGGTY